MIRYRVVSLSLILSAMVVAGCDRQEGPTSAPSKREVVVYAALDRELTEPILNEFSRVTGIRVLAQYDVESTKTVGLANRIRAEAPRPRCDVFWNNEILNTLLLKKEGVLSPCQPAEAKNYAPQWKDPEGYWYAFAARARIILVNTRLVPDGVRPSSIQDLADPEFKGRTAIAKPLFGTTASHIACLFAALGPEKATQYLDALKRNEVQVHGGNKGCAEAVAAGTAAFGLTDTDDAMAELDAGKPVRIVYPDSGPDGIGTLFLPNTLSVIKGAPHPAEAAELVNYLLSAAVENRLAEGPSAQIPLNMQAAPNPRVKGPGQVKAMAVDFAAAAAAFEQARQVVEQRFLR